MSPVDRKRTLANGDMDSDSDARGTIDPDFFTATPGPEPRSFVARPSVYARNLESDCKGLLINDFFSHYGGQESGGFSARTSNIPIGDCWTHGRSRLCR